jgi:hypothetical protein
MECVPRRLGQASPARDALEPGFSVPHKEGVVERVAGAVDARDARFGGCSYLESGA